MTGSGKIIGHYTCDKGHEANIEERHEDWGNGDIRDYVRKWCFFCSIAERHAGKPLDINSPSSVANHLFN